MSLQKTTKRREKVGNNLPQKCGAENFVLNQKKTPFPLGSMSAKNWRLSMNFLTEVTKPAKRKQKMIEILLAQVTCPSGFEQKKTLVSHSTAVAAQQTVPSVAAERHLREF